MERHRGRWAGFLLWVCSAAVLASCHDKDSPGSGAAGPAVETRSSALAADPAALVTALKARAGSPVGASVATGFDAVAGGKLKPRFAAGALAAEAKPARVTLPAAANAALHLEDVATGTAVDVSLQGAAAAVSQTTDGYVVYAAATASGATVVHRAVPSGTEDFIAMDAKPATTQIAYNLSLGTGAAGVRLVAGTLEVLDAGGAPRLRVAPPFIVGSDGTRTDATLAVAGCAVDTDPAPPWGRAVTAPGATTCMVRVTWPGSGVAYPAILDPRWTTTGSMGTPRYEHTLTLIASTGKVLAAGGRSSTGSTTALNTAELYDRTTGTWGGTGSFTGARRLHTATQLPTSGNSTTSGKILIAGGISGTTTLGTAQLYSPSAGTWAPAANLNAARHLHTETLLPDGRVLVSGGMNGTATLATAATYNPASGSGSWAATTGPIPPAGWRYGTATLIQTTNTQLNNHVLLVGGNNGTSTLSSVYLYDPVQNAFSTLASLSSPRESHTAVVLPNSNGKILVAGGKNGSTVLATALTFDPSFSNGSWSSAGTMTSARVGHTMVALPQSVVANGTVLVAGGSSTGSNTLSSAELFSDTNVWTATPSLSGPVQLAPAVTLPSNFVLLAGGLSASTTVTNAASLYDGAFGLGCSSAGQCPSGFCVDGVCCDVACGNSAANDCQACNLAGHLGTCTARPSGTSCRPSAGQCDVAETCNGSSFNCPTDAFAPSSTPCRDAVDVCDQAENCTGNSATCPADVKKTAGTACPDDNNVCTTDTCNGTSDACQHAPGNAGTQCRAAVDACDQAESCNGSSATCPADGKKNAGTPCPDDNNVCTTDTCNGSSNACQHAPGNAGTQCRVAAGDCDVAAMCTGSSTTCPANALKPGGTACPDDGNVCTTDTCNGSSATCQHPAGNAGTQCRAAAGVCDLAAQCTGSSATCPSNPFKPASTVCRAANGVCDADENCTGSSAACPMDAFKPSSTVCRASGGVCDLAENCTGSSAACPTDAFKPSTTECRASADVCDVAESCTGSSATCPTDAFKPSTTECRASAGFCDVAESCTGSSATCPADAFASSSTVCRASAGVCDVAENCTGTAAACPTNAFASSSTVCRAAAGQCDVAETCTGGSASCPGDTFASNGSSCSDGDNCTTNDSCQAGACMPGTPSPNCGGTTALELTQTITSQFSAPRATMTAPISNTTITPGDHIDVTATLNYYGVNVGISGTLDTKNVTNNPVAFVEQEGRLEYFSPSQNTWVVLARAAYETPFIVLPGNTPETSFGAGFRAAPGPGVHTTAFTLLTTTLDPDAIAKWGYSIQTVFTSAQLAILTDPTQASAARAVVRFETTGGGSDESSVDVTSAFRALVAPSFPSVNATATLQPNVGLAFYGIITVDLAATSPGPVAIDTTTVYTGRLDVPFSDVLRSIYAVFGNGPMPFPRTFWASAQQVNYFNRLDAFAATFNAFHAQVQAPPLFAFSDFVYMSTGIPSVHSTPHAPADIISGSPVQYIVDLANAGAGVAGPISFTHFADSQPVAGSTVTVTPPEVDPSETGNATIDFVAPLRPASARFDDWLVVTWSDRNGNEYGPVFLDPGSSLHVFPQGSLVVEQLVTQIVGDTASFSVAAKDNLDVPVAGLPVHVAITGVNPQTFDVLTGSDGVAHVSYTGTTMGNDSIVASATVVTDPIQSAPQKVVWASPIGTPCTGRATPLDIMLVVDVSPSMQAEPAPGGFTFSTGKLEAARAAGDRFIDDLTYPRDQVGVVTFDSGIVTSAQLATGAAIAKERLDAGIEGGIYCATNFCVGGSNVANALNFALDELESPRHRSDAQKVVVYIGDGGADVDPAAAIARLRSSGARTVAIGLGSNFDGQMSVVRQIADGPNDYFYSPSGAGIDFAFNNLNQDLCRNLVPFVSAGGDQGLYNVRIPSFLTLQGEVHDDGASGDQRLTSAWTKISGPGVVTFADATSPVTDALFELPGTYVLQLEASDGYLTVADRATITVDPDPSIVGATLTVSLSPPGPLETGQTETMTATLVDNLGAPIRDYALRVTVAGANPVITTLVTNALGVATFIYQGGKPGTDTLHATALGSTLSLDSDFVSLQWVQAASGGAFLTQGWIGAPTDQSRISERVDVTLSPDVTLASGTLKYYPTAAPTDVHFLATNVSRGPSATIATFDTTLVSNGSYIVQLDGTDNAGNQKTSVVLVTVEGDYKPGRVVVELTDFTVPIAGLPITVGRRYDSLEKDKVGDFGYGWSLVVGHPRLEVSPNFAVSLTLPNGRRATFDLNITAVSNELNAPNYFGVFTPGYQGEPGVFGKLTQEGACPLVRYNPGNPTNPIPCFLTGVVGVPTYAPEFYTYTDPYGTAYRMAATGELKSITDRQGNTLSFEPNGIVSSTGKSVSFVRDAQNRITTVDYPALFGANDHAAQYDYDPAGDLVTVTLPPSSNAGPETFQHTYVQHRLMTTVDPRNNPVRTSTYDANGRLETDKDALNNLWTYTYNMDTRTNTTTYPDTGVVTQVFDERGLLLSETDQRGHTTTHEYNPDRTEKKRTNALGEVTTAEYLNGNQTSVTDPKGVTQTEYDAFNLPTKFTDRLLHVTRIDYDDRHVPRRFSDELGTRFTLINSEQGLPLTVDDAEGHRAYLDYNAAGDVTGRTDWLGRTTRATYDEGGRKLTETTARGGVTTNQYTFGFGRLAYTTDPSGLTKGRGDDRNGNLTAESDNLLRGTNYTYDALNHLTSLVRYPDNSTVSYTRDFRGNPTSMTDENGHTTSYDYDKVGNLIKTTFPDDDADPNNNPFTTRTYDELNRLHSVTDERGNTTTHAYDEGCGCSDRVASVTDPLGHATVTGYDANGRRASVTDANNHTTTFDYDVRGHLTDTHYPDATSTHEEYDTRGRRVSMTVGIAASDLAGKTTLYGYDDQGQLTSVTDPLGNVTGYGYDLDGNLALVTDANNHTTRYEYDLMKRKTKRTLPMQQFETFEYDIGGRQIHHTDFRAKTTTMTYDGRDLMQTKVPDPSLGEPSEGYTYFANGLRHTATKGTETTSYTYDARDHLHTKTVPFAGTLTYGYDLTGNVASIVSSNTSGTNVEYGWDKANQLRSITDNNVTVNGVPVPTTATYTDTRRPDTLVQSNGVGLKYSYDALDRVTSMLWRQGTSPAFGSWAYAHNERGQQLSSTDITGRSAAYGYDDASRLTSEAINGDPRGASFNGALSYLLDGAGNRLSRASTLAVLGAQAFTYNANDEISGDTFDANGNTTASGGHTFGYDFEDRLVSKDGGAVTLQYNCDGDRVAKTVGGVTTRYLVDDLNPTGYLQVLEEVVSGAVQTRYTYGDRIVSQTRNVSTSPATSYYGYDAHGNIMFLTDTLGVVTDSYDLDGWGALVASTGSTPNTRLYAGEEFDPDLGLINLRARQYRPELGRFSTLDPLMGDPMRPLSLNRYLYADADATNRIDRLGLASGLEYDLKAFFSGTLAATRASITVGGAVGTATIETAAVRILGIAIACALVKASGAPPEEVLIAAGIAKSPILAALAVCATPILCTLAPGGARIRHCQYSCPGPPPFLYNVPRSQMPLGPGPNRGCAQTYPQSWAR